MIHERLDIARWKRMFPLASLRERAEQMVREWQARDPNRYQTAEEVREAILLVGPAARGSPGQSTLPLLSSYEMRRRFHSQ